MTQELKPCPFCGSDANMHLTSGSEVVGYVTTTTARCRQCGASRHGADTTDANGWACASDSRAKCIAAWNRRADLPPTLAQALELPEIAALVDAAMPYVSPVQNADYGRQLRQHDALVSALAKVRP